MSLLTQREIYFISSQIPGFIWTEGAIHESGVLPEEATEFARAIEAAVIARLATVSVEPCADVILVGHEKLIHMEDAALDDAEIGAKLYLAEALAAARVQERKRCGDIFAERYPFMRPDVFREKIGGQSD